MKRLAHLLFLLSALACSGPSGAAAPAPILIGFDGEYGLLGSTSAPAIERGIRLALDEINAAGGVLGGRPLELVTRDNRSVPARGLANLEEFAKMPDLVAVFGGRFSPVILQQLEKIHTLKLPFLDAWGSATGIIQHDYQPSYTFRLSLYDRIAVPYMIDQALAMGGKRLGLLLPNTGWGRSNHAEAQRYTDARGIRELPAVWYNWGEEQMIVPYQKLLRQGVDIILLVANDAEASKLARELTQQPREEWRPIVAHWGITGGEMAEKSGPGLFDLDLRVIQTFSFFTAEGAAAERVMTALRERQGVKGAADIPSPVGVAHAYDLTHLLARAIEMAGATDRERIRDALERIENYEGLTGHYDRPFTPERHDALTIDHLFMARYRRDGAVVPLDYEDQAR